MGSGANPNPGAKPEEPEANPEANPNPGDSEPVEIETTVHIPFYLFSDHPTRVFVYVDTCLYSSEGTERTEGTGETTGEKEKKGKG